MTPRLTSPALRQRMRIFAIINLFYLTLLTASTVSAVHVDHEGSHENACTSEINARCHAEVPHEHDEAHGGEESLFEHTFENGIRKNHTPAFVTAPLLTLTLVSPLVPDAEVILVDRLLCDFCDLTPLSVFFGPTSPRAPPVI